MQQHPQPCAEIISSSLHSWIGESWQWDYSPCFGEIVTAHSNGTDYYGIVTTITTGSSDPHRTPFAYQKTREQLEAEHPHIFEFLQTHFTCSLLCYKPSQGNTLHHNYAPNPPSIHSFIRQATIHEAEAIFFDSLYLQRLFAQVQDIPIDELIIGCITHYRNFFTNEKRLEELIHTYTLLINNDYRRLRLFLQRIQAIIYQSSEKSDIDT